MSLDKLLTQGDKVTDRMIAESEKQILQAYKSSLKEIRAQTALLYEKHAVDGVLSMADVAKYNRLANLEKSIATEVSRLAGTERRLTTKVIKDVYQESFYRTAFGVEHTAQAALGFGMLNPKQVEAAVLNPLDRIGWPDRSKENARLATRQIKEQVTRGIIQGKPYSEVAKAVTERANVAASRAIRIAQTEAHRAQQSGRLESLLHAEAKGVEMVKIWTSTLDGRTRDSHQALDGQKVGMDEDFTSPLGGSGQAPGMLGTPEDDINCRCSIRAEIVGYSPEVRRARGEGVIPYTNYRDWAGAKGIELKYKGPEPRVIAIDKTTPIGQDKIIKPVEAMSMSEREKQIAYLQDRDFNDVITAVERKELRALMDAKKADFDPAVLAIKENVDVAITEDLSIPIWSGKRRALPPQEGRTYYHVVKDDYTPGDSLQSFERLASKGEKMEWKWEFDPVDIEKVSLHDNLAEAIDFQKDYGGRILEIAMPDLASEGLEGGVNQEGYAFVYDRIPGEFVKVLAKNKLFKK